MCRVCVDEGHMTQAELDQALAAGDPTVQPMIELSPERFAEANRQMMVADIAAGEDITTTILRGAYVAAEYARHTVTRLN